jgi:hypothetical protein
MSQRPTGETHGLRAHWQSRTLDTVTLMCTQMLARDTPWFRFCTPSNGNFRRKKAVHDYLSDHRPYDILVSTNTNHFTVILMLEDPYISFS